MPTPPALIDPKTSRGSIIKVYALSPGQHKEFKADAERQGILWEGLGFGGAGGGVFGGGGFGGGAPGAPGAVAVQYTLPQQPQYPGQVQPVGQQYEAKNQEYMQQPFGGMGQPVPQNNFVQPVPQNIEMAPIQRPPGALPAAPMMVVAPAMPGVLLMAWTCPHCTVVNDPSATICCVCSKSRPAVVAGGGGQAGGQGIMAGALGF